MLIMFTVAALLLLVWVYLPLDVFLAAGAVDLLIGSTVYAYLWARHRP